MRKFAFFAFAAVLAATSLAACDRKAGEGLDQSSAEDQAMLDKNAAEARAFLEKNAKEPGVVVLPDGLQYKIVRSGPAGGVHPKPEDEIKIHYEGKLLNGKVFDSSYERGSPATFQLGGLIPAWVEALQLMKPGDEWMLYVPPALGYGERGAGEDIEPNSALIFRIELIDILPA